MRPEDRVALFERGMEAFLSGDMEAALRFYAPDVEASAADWMNVGIFKGREGFIKMNELWNEAWEQWSYDVRNVQAVGARHVVARVRVGGRGRGSGIEVNEEVGYVIDINDEGLASYLEITKDEERALQVAHEREVSN
jgi:ketosteroid isomerase-like protein